MFLVIDNYDSFTYNLVHYFGEEEVEVNVVRNDALTVSEVALLSPEGIILSPGPGTPESAGICLDIIKNLGGAIPIFGVCLGHQAIAQAYGANICRAPILMHGKISTIHHKGEGVFSGINNSFKATRYHSLIVEESTLPSCLHPIAWSEDGILMGVQHKDFPIYGVQFHPESIASENGRIIIRNFIHLAQGVI